MRLSGVQVQRGPAEGDGDGEGCQFGAVPVDPAGEGFEGLAGVMLVGDEHEWHLVAVAAAEPAGSAAVHRASWSRTVARARMSWAFR